MLVFIASSLNAISQNEKETTLLLTIEEPWRSEHLPFPISFAPSLDYKGIEEVRFAKGWGSPESGEFWTYAFLWYLDEDPKLSQSKLETDIEAYFDGLMSVVGKDIKDIPKTKATFTNDGMVYQGKARIYDAFFTKELITLQIDAVSEYCTQKEKYTVLFTISPQPRDHSVWKTLTTIDLAFTCN